MSPVNDARPECFLDCLGRSKSPELLLFAYVFTRSLIGVIGGLLGLKALCGRLHEDFW